MHCESLNAYRVRCILELADKPVDTRGRSTIARSIDVDVTTDLAGPQIGRDVQWSDSAGDIEAGCHRAGRRQLINQCLHSHARFTKVPTGKGGSDLDTKPSAQFQARISD